MSTPLSARPARFTIARYAIVALWVLIGVVWQPTAVSGQVPADFKPKAQPPLDTSSKPWTGKRLPDGQPDVSTEGGLWANTYGGTGRLDNPWSGSSYNSPTTDPFKNPRPSRIIDPADGKIPYQPWALALQIEQEKHLLNPTKPEHIDTQSRCLPGGIPRLNYYVGHHKILQAPGQVIFMWDRFHIYRVVQLDDKSPRLAPNVKLWMGDSRGRWDGNTLVVETTNYNGKHRLTSQGDFMSENVSLVERFVFLAPDRVAYEVTITDPTVYTRPWTMRVEQKRQIETGVEAEIWEAACWEGNAERPNAIDSRVGSNGR